MAQPITMNQAALSHRASEGTFAQILDPSKGGSEADALADSEPAHDLASAQDKRCEPLIDAVEAASILGIHVSCLKARAAKHEIPGFKIGARWKFRKSVLDRWIQAQLSSTRFSRP
jgi:excisionase family DNA binding protein